MLSFCLRLTAYDALLVAVERALVARDFINTQDGT
jgi:hypothetical protein